MARSCARTAPVDRVGWSGSESVATQDGAPDAELRIIVTVAKQLFELLLLVERNIPEERISVAIGRT